MNTVDSAPPEMGVPRNMRYIEENSSDDDEFSFALSSTTDKKLPIAKLTIEGMRIDFLVDSGATVNVLDAKDFNAICAQSNGHVQLKRTNARLFAFGSTQPLSLQVKFDTLIESRKRMANATFYVTKESSGNTSLLSYATSADLGLITLPLNSVGSTAKSSRQRETDNKERMHDSRRPSATRSLTNESVGLATSQKKQAILRAKFPGVFEGIGKLTDHEQKLHIDPSVPPVSQTYPPENALPSAKTVGHLD